MLLYICKPQRHKQNTQTTYETINETRDTNDENKISETPPNATTTQTPTQITFFRVWLGGWVLKGVFANNERTKERNNKHLKETTKKVL